MDKEKLLSRLSKVQALIERGSTEGEKAAARIQFDKIIANNGLTDDDLINIVEKTYCFKYANRAEEILLMNLYSYLKDLRIEDNTLFSYSGKANQRKLYGKLTVLEHVEMTAMYEYFRRHMKTEYKKILKGIKSDHFSFDTSHSRLQKKVRLGQEVFIYAYLRKSGIKAKTDKRAKSVSLAIDQNLLDNLEGGVFFQQVNADSRMLDHKES